MFGYKGKQVRDNIHSEDVARFMLAFAKNLVPGKFTTWVVDWRILVQSWKRLL